MDRMPTRIPNKKKGVNEREEIRIIKGREEREGREKGGEERKKEKKKFCLYLIK